MTERQRLFAEEYLVDQNASRAYRTAYPSVTRDETAAAAGERLLRNEQVAAYLRERLRERPDQDKVLRGIMDIAFADADEDARVRLRALELLGRHLGTFRAPKDELDRQEQEARIAKLRAAAQDGGTDRELRVVFVNTDGAEE